MTARQKKLCEPQLGTRKIAYADENRVEAEIEVVDFLGPRGYGLPPPAW